MTSPTKRMSRKAAAEYLGRCVSTLDKWRAQRVCLPFYKDEKLVWYDQADLDAYLAAKRVEPIAYGCPQVAQSDGEAA
jgi:hypothetical protein